MNKKYDLEERTFQFAKACLALVNKSSKTLVNVEISRQLIRSSGSVGANYIEANESLSKKDFIYRIKICRKESKESGYWIRLLELEDQLNMEAEILTRESRELTNIFGSILRKTI
ncbi:MAG: four helix bundle protein [Balneolaceae bacterium]|nr:four helix bundle protein [Balneolaceae bacterium]